ncbi:hypothetical protein ScPMuIL_002046 [Solemya velum]
MDNYVKLYNEEFGMDICSLKSLQERAINSIIKNDVICMLPTGYGKSLIYEILPIVCREKLKRDACVIVLEPLNVIIQQQMLKLGSKALTLSKNMCETWMKRLECGDCSYIFCHPENIIGEKNIYTILSKKAYSSKLVFIVVDEAHCVIQWGLEYRPIYREIKQLRSVLPHANILALTATLSLQGQKELQKYLLMRNTDIIATPPSKDNISLIVVPRPFITPVQKTYDYVFQPVFLELKKKGQDFPLTIIYCSGSMDWVGYGIEVAWKVLGDDMYAGEKKTENQRVVMYHSSIEKGDEVKKIIYTNLSTNPSESPLKIVIATIALGMGADLRHVSQVIHAGPPKSMEAYIQQTGRAGRDGTQATAVLFWNKSDIGRPDVTQAVKDYCRNCDNCRRSLIDSYFGFGSASSDKNVPICCDICDSNLKNDWLFTPPLNSLQIHAIRTAIQSFVKIQKIQISSMCVESLASNASYYVNAENILKEFKLSETIANALSSIISQLLEIQISK